MSIINKVLNDLDKRGQPTETNGVDGRGSAVATDRHGGRRWLFILLALIVLVAVGVISYVMVFRSASPPPASESVLAADVTEQKQSVDTSTERVANNGDEPESSQPPVEPQQPAAEKASQTLPFTLPPTISGDEPTENAAATVVDKSTPVAKEESTSSFSKQAVTLTAEEIAERERQKADRAQKQGLFSDAAAHYQAALNTQPQLHDVRKAWAALEYGRGQTSKALTILRQGLADFPDAHSLRLLAASMLQKQEQPQLALRLLEQRQPNAAELPQYYQLQATLAQTVGDTAAMQQSYAALVEIEPDNGRWRLGLALALREQNPAQSLTEFERAATLIDHAPTLNFIAKEIKALRSQHAASTP